MNIDTLIHARWVIPVAPDERVLEHHALALQDGRILEILSSDEAREKYRPIKEHDLPTHALIPGLILEVLVKPGQRVRRGDGMVVLEAMKMENKLLSEKEGIVKSINVRVGDSVLQEDVMIELELS